MRAEVGVMRAVIVYESLFGNTREAAEAVGDGIRATDPAARVLCVRVADVTADLVEDADLLVVGGPTHMRAMTSGLSRKMGLQGEAKKAADFHPEPSAAGPGLRDWFRGLPSAKPGSLAAAFDTRVDSRMAGGAAQGIARRLEGHGYGLTAKPEGFVVDDAEGPLHEGERSRAKAWGASLCLSVAMTSF